MEKDLVMRASHTHPNFKEDNSNLYYYIEKATRSPRYAASINPYHKNNNGRDAFIAFVDQYTGEDNMQKLFTDSDEIFQNQRWSVKAMFTLEKFISTHRNLFIMMTQYSNHVD